MKANLRREKGSWDLIIIFFNFFADIEYSIYEVIRQQDEQKHPSGGMKVAF